MKSLFEPRSPHLKAAHDFFREHLRKGDQVFDATLGNGHDTAFVAPLVLPTGKVIACDLQEEAFQKSKRLVGDAFAKEIEWVHGSHAEVPLRFPDHSLTLAIYNLGYLPGGDKALITQKDSTLQSLSLIMNKLNSRGALSITTYSGHPGGADEEKAVTAFIEQLDQRKWSAVALSWPNRPKSPKLFLVKALEQTIP